MIYYIYSVKLAPANIFVYNQCFGGSFDRFFERGSRFLLKFQLQFRWGFRYATVCFSLEFINMLSVVVGDPVVVIC